MGIVRNRIVEMQKSFLKLNVPSPNQKLHLTRNTEMDLELELIKEGSFDPRVQFRRQFASLFGMNVVYDAATDHVAE